MPEIFIYYKKTFLFFTPKFHSILSQQQVQLIFSP